MTVAAVVRLGASLSTSQRTALCELSAVWAGEAAKVMPTTRMCWVVPVQ